MERRFAFGVSTRQSSRFCRCFDSSQPASSLKNDFSLTALFSAAAALARHFVPQSSTRWGRGMSRSRERRNSRRGRIILWTPTNFHCSFRAIGTFVPIRAIRVSPPHPLCSIAAENFRVVRGYFHPCPSVVKVPPLLLSAAVAWPYP